MEKLILLTTLILAFLAYYYQTQITINYRRKTLKQSSFPEEWIDFLSKYIYLYRIIPQELKQELHSHIKIFLHEKEFISYDKQPVNIETKLAIASQACLLLLGDKRQKRNYFPYLKYIYIYPDLIIQKKGEQMSAILSGQSSVGNKSGKDGVVSLSWQEVIKQSSSPHQRENVILHEFAHQLDQEFGTATGVPRLSNLQETLIWGEILKKEYEKHYQAVQKGKITIIDPYGATNMAEFFAVVTEAFFLKSKLLAAYHPLLYNQLSNYYGVNPIEWKPN